MVASTESRGELQLSPSEVLHPCSASWVSEWCGWLWINKINKTIFKALASCFLFYALALFWFVTVPPSIDEANLVANPRVVVNRTVQLECPVDGIPPPTVIWLKNNEPIESTAGLVIVSEGRQLEIASAQVTDTARYTCIASNVAGELRRNFDLEVLGNYLHTSLSFC